MESVISTTQAMHYKSNIETHARNYFHRGTALSVTYFECVPYSFSTLYRYLWSAWLYDIFTHFLINFTDYGYKLLNIKYVY